MPIAVDDRQLVHTVSLKVFQLSDIHRTHLFAVGQVGNRTTEYVWVEHYLQMQLARLATVTLPQSIWVERYLPQLNWRRVRVSYSCGLHIW